MSSDEISQNVSVLLKELQERRAGSLIPAEKFKSDCLILKIEEEVEEDKEEEGENQKENNFNLESEVKSLKDELSEIKSIISYIRSINHFDVPIIWRCKI